MLHLKRMLSPESRKLALVLPAGGARAAYQVGVLRHIAENFPEFQPRIFSGVSAGSINSSFLAQGEPFPAAVQELYRLWESLEFSQVFRTNFRSLFSMGSRWIADMFISKVTRRLLLKSLLDASPLADTLLTHLSFSKMARAVRSGKVDGVSVSATNYHSGTTVVFYDTAQPVPVWQRERRRAVHTRLRVRHIMASCSIPILFAPVRIGDFLYGDGALRFSFPLSPAIHLGATHLFTIGTRCPKPENPLGYRPEHVGIGFIAGAILNSIFLDSLESDYEHLCRLNESQSPKIRPIHPCLVRPSQDLGASAKDFLSEVPFHFRQLLISTANPAELGDLLSYLMFTPGFIRSLLKLGQEDAANAHSQIENFLKQEANSSVA